MKALILVILAWATQAQFRFFNSYFNADDPLLKDIFQVILNDTTAEVNYPN